jgi:CRP-like cAMP-binding protein
MDFINDIEKDTIIYKEGDEADCLYFVKEGIVLL